MKIKCEPGVVVRLDKNRTSSVRGGVYEITDEKFAKEALTRKGVTQADRSKPAEVTSGN